MKTCSKCSEQKPIKDFEANNKRPDGIGSRCKKCATAIHKKYRPPVSGKTQPRKKTRAESVRREQIVRYGIAVVEAMESTTDF